MPETFPFKCVVFIRFPLCFVPVLGGCNRTSSNVICKMILRVMTRLAASVWDSDTGGCLKPSSSNGFACERVHIQALFSLRTIFPMTLAFVDVDACKSACVLP